MNSRNIVILFVLLFGATFMGLNAQETVDLPAGYWSIPKTSSYFKIGGYVKFDMIYDMDPINSPDFFDVSKIPTDGSEGTNFNLNAKETRLFLDIRTPFKSNTIKTYVEGDFYGSSGAFRLRHAYVDIADKLLAGQYWSNFMDESIIPPTLDFEKPGAYAFVRLPMIRYKHKFSDNAYLGIALEAPGNNAIAPPSAGKYETGLPDLTLRFRYTKPWGHVQLSGFGSALTYRYQTGGTEQTTLYGVNLSGQFNILKKDKLTYQALYGPGIARYRGGILAAPDENGDIVAATDQGFTVGYQHFWSDKWSSFAIYNYGSTDPTGGEPGSSVADLSYIAVNLLWHFTHNAFAGIEYMYGKRVDQDDSDGTANRIQMSVSYTFN